MVDGKYKCIKNWKEALLKLKSAHRFFQGLKMSGVLEGSKLQPAIDINFPDGIFAYQRTQKYKIFSKRGLKSINLKKDKALTNA
ncbi:hypothetical protein ATZ36_04165 [Candidatus Endomicrobiellum trichonymphae]|uniref:Uncharacterized protein n=1 Tax=Endomicrobium trichonymphae TaxID=1408204 RepID=A0A1E5IJD0_ENDTX|nr:hypothetical protein ATZ36_04165 [Candidatus Endomicrobium trichonymphae]